MLYMKTSQYSKVMPNHRTSAKKPSYFGADHRTSASPLHLRVLHIYKKSTRKCVFNYSKVCEDLNISENTPSSCNCSNSEYIYGPISYVISGDLNIVRDRELKSFLSKGPKYRPPLIINWNECRNISSPTHSVLTVWNGWYGEKLTKNLWALFSNSVMNIVDILIQHFKEHFNLNNQKPYVPYQT